MPFTIMSGFCKATPAYNYGAGVRPGVKSRRGDVPPKTRSRAMLRPLFFSLAGEYYQLEDGCHRLETKQPPSLPTYSIHPTPQPAPALVDNLWITLEPHS